MKLRNLLFLTTLLVVNVLAQRRTREPRPGQTTPPRGTMIRLGEPFVEEFVQQNSPRRKPGSPGAQVGSRGLAGMLGRILTPQPPDNIESELHEGETVDNGDSVTLNNGATMIRGVHKIDGIKVWNSGATFISRRAGARSLLSFDNALSGVSTSNFSMLRLQGRSLANPSLSKDICKQYFGERAANLENFEGTVERFVYNNDLSGNPIYADYVYIRGVKPNGRIFAKYCLINSKKNEVIDAWTAIRGGTWTGGNVKTGQYTYGQSKPSLYDKIKSSGRSCSLESNDGAIKIYHMDNQGGSVFSKSPYSFSPCSNGPQDQDSRSYGALSDSMYHAYETVQMLRHRDWGDLSKLTPSGVLHFGVHFQRNLDNAFWDGSALYFGDGSSFFYPLGTCLDVVAHEIGHAVTQVQSDLKYSDEPGCMNEAFSDILGEMAEYYVKSTNDWCIAKDCMVPDWMPCLRKMNTPAKYSDYFPYCSGGGRGCQDPHKCSSVPNYIFYTLATSNGWNTKEAGKAFILANRLYWQQETSLRQTGCTVASAVKEASIKGGDTLSVVEAWQAAGIDISGCVPNPTRGNGEPWWYTRYPTAAPTTTTTTTTTTRPRTEAPGSSPNNPIRIRNCYEKYVSAATGEKKYFVVRAPYGTSTQNIQIYGEDGDADLYIKAGRPPTLSDYDDAPFWWGSDEWSVKRITRNRIDYYIMVDAALGYTDLEVYACFY